MSKVVDMATPASTTEYIEPCYVATVGSAEQQYKLIPNGVIGYRHMMKDASSVRIVSHCLPCDKANSKGEKVTCQGDGKE